MRKLYNRQKCVTCPNWKHLQTTNNYDWNLLFFFWKVENIMEERENSEYQHFLYFSTTVYKAFLLSLVKTWDHVKRVNPLLHWYSIWRINNRQLLKTLWEKEKLLITGNFSFSTMFSTQSDNCIPIFPYFWHHTFVCYWIGKVKIGILGKRLKKLIKNNKI